MPSAVDPRHVMDVRTLEMLVDPEEIKALTQGHS